MPPRKRSQKTSDPIQSVRHVDNLTTQRVTSILKIERYDGSVGELQMPRFELRSVAKVQAALDNAGANLATSVTAGQLAHLSHMCPENTRTVVSQSGWMNKHFAFPNRVDRSTRAHVHFIERVSADPQLHPLYRRRGSTAAWWRGVGPAARQSDPMIMAIGVAFSQPIMRFSDASEGAILNLAGESGAGKTLVTRVAQSCLGRAKKKDLTAWDNTSVGLEEMLGATEGIPIIIDDGERGRGTTADRIRNLQAAGRMAADGGRRRRASGYEGENGVLALREPRLGLSSAELTLSQEAREQGITLKKGALVRFIDIPVAPKIEGGVFNRPDSDENTPLEAQAKRLQAVITKNYGHPFRQYLRHLERNFSGLGRAVSKESGKFIRWAQEEQPDVLSEGSAPRMLDKFALIAAALNLSREAGIHDLSPNRINLAIGTCLLDAVENVKSSVRPDLAATQRLKSILADDKKAPILRRGDPLPDQCCAYKRLERGVKIAYVDRGHLARLVGIPQSGEGAFLDQLQDANAFLGDSKTTRSVRIANARRRFLAFNEPFWNEPRDLSGGPKKAP